MFSLGAGEILFILIAALLVLGPKRLPELARGIGRFLRELRRQTDEVRTVVEREFYRMDQEPEPLPKLVPPEGTRPAGESASSAAPAVDAAPAPSAAPAALEPSQAPPLKPEPSEGPKP